MDDLYREVILDHYQHPHNHGTLDQPDIAAEDTNPLCGDRIRMEMKVRDGIVEDIKFTGKGCAISQASASMLTDEIKGKPLEAIKHLDKQAVYDLIGFPLSPSRVKCAMLPLKVAKTGAYGITQWPDEEGEED